MPLAAGPGDRRLGLMDMNLLKRALDDAVARGVAILGLVALALIHVVQLPDTFDEAGYLGGLFIAAAAGCLVLAAVLTRTSDDRAWMAAAGLPALILLGYVLSRSVGLPGFTADEGEWASPRGLEAMVAEALVICVSFATLASRQASGAGNAQPFPRFARDSSAQAHRTHPAP